MSAPRCDGRDVCDRVHELEQERFERNGRIVDLLARVAELEEENAELRKSAVVRPRAWGLAAGSPEQLVLERVLGEANGGAR